MNITTQLTAVHNENEFFLKNSKKLQRIHKLTLSSATKMFSWKNILLEKEYLAERKRIIEYDVKWFFQSDVPKKPYYSVRSCLDGCNPKVITLCGCNDYIVCPVCRAKRIKRLKEKYLLPLQQMKSPKLLTLTYKREKDIKSSLEGLKKSFKKLKRRKQWKSKVSKYFGSYEVTTNNVHLHLVIDSNYWNQGDISKEWLSITKTSFIVDIRMIKGRTKALKEVFKYIVKDGKRELAVEVSEFRIDNRKARFVVSSRGLSSLDTKAISGHFCESCNGDLYNFGQIDCKHKAEDLKNIWVESGIRPDFNKIRAPD
jgi:hypothetical protein